MIKINTRENDSVCFPKLMRGPYSSIILFVNKYQGTILWAGTHEVWTVGEFCGDLDIDCCLTYRGTLEMSNE